jgi:hypothetical protein
VPTFADGGLSLGQPGGTSTALNLGFIDRNYCFFLPSSSSVILTILSGPPVKPTATQKILYRWEEDPGPLGLQSGTLNTRPQKWSSYGYQKLLFACSQFAGVTHSSTLFNGTRFLITLRRLPFQIPAGTFDYPDKYLPEHSEVQ